MVETIAVIPNEQKYFYSYTVVRAVRAAVAQKVLKQQKPSEDSLQKGGRWGNKKKGWASSEHFCSPSGLCVHKTNYKMSNNI